MVSIKHKLNTSSILDQLHLQIIQQIQSLVPIPESSNEETSHAADLLQSLLQLNRHVEQIHELLGKDDRLETVIDAAFTRYTEQSLQQQARHSLRDIAISTILSAIAGWLSAALASPTQLIALLSHLKYG